MKGAIGNAFILNMVITFIIIFFSLLIGSMAYSKAYKTKNFIMNAIDENINNGDSFQDFSSYTKKGKEFNDKVNEYLGRIGYPIAEKTNPSTCPSKDGYEKWKSPYAGEYEYCIYRKNYITSADNNSIIQEKYNYMVLVYMKFDIPVIGQFIKLPVTGETKTYTNFK